ncbi:hypothetical protein [Alkalicoccus chagannorensis]|uniref:hypothetical protein n=1 Tax=Alkalicoccus chagannorensis TaxID=427072 RepID=UPI00041315B4|nr:hypothetical protein [Alkalicoccus chagannorensis]
MYKQSMDLMQAPVIMTDKHLYIEYTNPAFQEFFFSRRMDVHKRHLHDCFTNMPAVLRAVTMAAEHKNRQYVAPFDEIVNGDVRTLTVDAVYEPSSDAGGPFITAVITDVTEWLTRAAEQNARQQALPEKPLMAGRHAGILPIHPQHQELDPDVFTDYASGLCASSRIKELLFDVSFLADLEPRFAQTLERTIRILHLMGVTCSLSGISSSSLHSWSMFSRSAVPVTYYDHLYGWIEHQYYEEGAHHLG